jgi:hypothetical protein
MWSTISKTCTYTCSETNKQIIIIKQNKIKKTSAGLSIYVIWLHSKSIGECRNGMILNS